MQRGLSSTGLLPIAVIFSIYIKGRWSGMKAGHPKRTAHRGQTWGLIKAQPSQAQTGFEVRHIKSTGSKVRQRTDLHLTLQLEMVISRCNDDPCLTVMDDTTVGDTSHMCEYVCVCMCPCICMHKQYPVALTWTQTSINWSQLVSHSHACECWLCRYSMYCTFTQMSAFGEFNKNPPNLIKWLYFYYTL